MANVLSVSKKFTGVSVLLTATTDELADSELIFDEDININRIGTSSTIHKYLVTGLSINTEYSYIIRFKFSNVSLDSIGTVTTNSNTSILNIDGTTTLPGGGDGEDPGEDDDDTSGEGEVGSQIDFLTVDVFADLPAADLNKDELFLVLNESQSGVDVKYGGFYRSDGTNWNFLGASASDILLLSQLDITEHKNFDSEVTPDQVGKGGFFDGYFYFAHTVGEAGSGQSQWSRTATASTGF